MFTQLIRFYLVILALLTTTLGVQAQAERGSRCQKLDTEYGIFNSNSDWRWLDADTVMFGVWNGLPDDGLTKSLYAWYQYHLTTGLLEKLKDNPYTQLNIAPNTLSQLENVQAGLNGLYENVNLSPGQDKIIYPRQDGTGQDTWLVDTRSGIETPLGIGLGYTEAFWSTDEQKVVLAGLGGTATYVSPMYLVTLINGEVTVQRLDEIKPLSDVIPASKNYIFYGISPDGSYLLFTPELAKYETWVSDFNQQKANGLGFLIYGGIRVVWMSTSEFIGVTSLGAIRYDITTGKMDVLAQPSEIGLYEPNLPNDAFTIGDGSLSSDGRYLIAEGGQSRERQIVVCMIY